MKTETYKGRKLRAVAGRGRDWGYTLVTVNGVSQGSYLGNEDHALCSMHGTIDHVDAVGMGNGRYTPEWYVPGTYELNEAGHVVAPGGTCSCSYCARRPWDSCQSITAGGACICAHCMKPYL